MPEFAVFDPTSLTLSVTTELDFVGPPSGDPNLVTVITFIGFTPTAIPNVLVSTGNPHWTGHAIWVNLSAAGIVINRKTRPPGTQAFKAYFHVMATVAAPFAASDTASLQLETMTIQEAMDRGLYDKEDGS